MKSYYKGSLTVEAAIVIPIFLFSMVFILYFLKVIYIHEQIQTGIEQVAEELSAQSYLLYQADIIDLQQALYSESSTKAESSINSITNIKENVEVIKSTGDNVIATEAQIRDIVLSGSTNSNSTFYEKISEFIIELSDLKQSMSSMIFEVVNSFTEIINELELLISDADSLIQTLGAYEGVIFLNNSIGTSVVKSNLKNYVSEEECELWGIVGGYNGLDFSQSSYLLENDDIKIIVTYKLENPYGLILFEEISMKQSVCIRGFVGNGNFMNGYSKVDEEVKDEENLETVFVTPNGKVYHTDEKCYYIFTDVKEMNYSLVKGNKTICKVCESDDVELTPSRIIYTTYKSNIFHTNSECYTINATVNEITLEEAIEAGLRLCSSKTCQESK